MSNWKLINQTIIYDGTFNGFLNIVFQCYSNKFLPQKIYDEKTYSPNFLDKTMYIDTDYTKSERVFNGINNNIGYEVLYNSFYAFLSDEKEKEMNINEPTELNRLIIQEAVNQFKEGKDYVANYFVGQVMKKTKGQASPVKTLEIINEEIRKR